MNPFQESDFNHIMIASMNDMKQSLNLLVNTLEKASLPDSGTLEQSDLSLLHYELSRMQNGVIQLQNLYALERGELSLQYTDSYLLDLIEEHVAAHEVLSQRMGVKIAISGDSDVNGYVDVESISHVLDIAIVSAIRYSESRIHVQLEQSERGVNIIIDDDGRGYPESALERFNQVISEKELSGLTNQTLAWYYCHLVASLHVSRKEKGSLSLSNDSSLGGSRFEIFLP